MYEWILRVSICVILSENFDSFSILETSEEQKSNMVLVEVEWRLTLPLEMSQRGDSGMNQTRDAWRIDGSACNREGILK